MSVSKQYKKNLCEAEQMQLRLGIYGNRRTTHLNKRHPKVAFLFPHLPRDAYTQHNCVCVCVCMCQTMC